MSKEISDCLQRERDICVKTIKPNQKTAFINATELRTSADAWYGLRLCFPFLQGNGTVCECWLLVPHLHDMRECCWLVELLCWWSSLGKWRWFGNWTCYRQQRYFYPWPGSRYSYGGSFEQSQSFFGQIYGVNMWIEFCLPMRFHTCRQIVLMASATIWDGVIS